MKSLKEYQKLKKKIKYNLIFKSSAFKNKISASLGTIEKDASGFLGKHRLRENFRGEKIIDYFGEKNFQSMLEIGGGDGKVSLHLIEKYNKKVDLIELRNSYYLKK